MLSVKDKRSRRLQVLRKGGVCMKRKLVIAAVLLMSASLFSEETDLRSKYKETYKELG
jgi:hypothetical protein